MTLKDIKPESPAQTLQNDMTGALIGLARALEGRELTLSSKRVIVQGLSMALPGSHTDTSGLEEMAAVTNMIRSEKRQAAPDCASCQAPCGRTDDYDMNQMWQEEGLLRSKKFLLLCGLCAVASSLLPSIDGNEPAEEVIRFLCDGLFLLGYAYKDSHLDSILARIDGVYLSSQPILCF